MKQISVHPLRAGLLLGLLFIVGCANFRAYFNAYFNAEKAFERAGTLKERRLKKNPLDTVDVAAEEKKQYERAIEKGSKVLELYGHNENKYLPKSLFIIGESYLKLKEYRKAIRKYEELEKSYPDFEQLPLAQFHKAKCLFLSAPYVEARAALLEFIATTDNPAFKHEAMEDFAQLERENNSDYAGLEAYRKLLQENNLPPEARAKIVFECARLSFRLEQWKEARGFSTMRDVKLLPSEIRYESEMIAAKSLYELGEKKKAIGELEMTLKNDFYAKYTSEIQIILAQWYFADENPKKALDMLENITVVSPKTAPAAEAWYRMGDYHLNSLKEEEKALDRFDSAAAAGDSLEYAKKGKEMAESLRKLVELRKKSGSGDSRADIANSFYLAELFLFRLDNPDSAIGHMNQIVADTAQDSLFTLKAAYARAYISDEFTEDKSVSDSLYRYVLKEYPNSEYAKQAEYNLGLVPSVKTDEDKAHALFLEAEKLNFSGYNLKEQVLPAFQKVVDEYPATRDAAKAQFVIAMLHEDLYQGGEDYSLYLAKLSHSKVRHQYKDSPYYEKSHNKLLEAGIQPGDTIAYVTPALDTGGAPADTSAAKPAMPEVSPKAGEEEGPNFEDEEEEESEEVLDEDVEDEYY